MKVNISIRSEEEKDYRAVEELTRDAFWDLYHPGASEHFILHKIRKIADFVPELDCVAFDDEKIVGNIIYSRAKVINARGKKFWVLCMGPFCVEPSRQKAGIGAMLLNHTIKKAKELGFKAIVIFGNPGYYQRFGFSNAKNYMITTIDGQNFDAFMVLELYPGALRGVSGKFHADPVFHVDERELDEFDKSFPSREKHVTDTQLKE